VIFSVPLVFRIGWTAAYIAPRRVIQTAAFLTVAAMAARNKVLRVVVTTIVVIVVDRIGGSNSSLELAVEAERIRLEYLAP